MAEALKKADYKQPYQHIERGSLFLDFKSDQHVDVEARLRVTRDITNEEVSKVLVLDWHRGEDLKTISLFNGERLEFEKTGKQIAITLPAYLWDEPTIGFIFNATHDPSKTPTNSTGLYQLHDSKGRSAAITSQCEPPPGISNIIPFDDRSDQLTFWETITLRGKKENFPTLLAIGERVKIQDEGEYHSATYSMWNNEGYQQPISPYLLAVFAGKLCVANDTYVSTRPGGKETRLEIYFENEEDTPNAAMVLKTVEEILAFLENELKVDYPLSEIKIVACEGFPYAAMENPGMIPVQKKLLLGAQEFLLDEDWLWSKRALAHELLHGNQGIRYVRKASAEIHVVEAVNTFFTSLWSEKNEGAVWIRSIDMEDMRKKAFLQDNSPNACPISGPDELTDANDIFNKYGAILYYKGAEVIRMLYTLIGEEDFIAMFRQIYKKYNRKALGVDELWEAIFEYVEEQKRDLKERFLHLDLHQFKDTWYRQTGTLTCKLSSFYDADRGIFAVKVSQKLPHPDGDKPYYFPMTLGLLDRDGNDMPLQMVTVDGQPLLDAAHDTKRGVIHVSGEKETFYFKVDSQPQAFSAFRHWSAPIKIETDEDEASLYFRMKYDRDGINRLEAAREITMRTYKALHQQLKKGDPLEVPENVLAAYENIFTLPDKELDMAVIMLTPQPLLEVMDILEGPLAIQEVHDVIKTLKRSIALHHREKFEKTFLKLKEELSTKDGEKDSLTINKRLMKNICLEYLLTLDDKPEYAEWGMDQAKKPGNVTDRYSALKSLGHREITVETPPISKYEFACSDTIKPIGFSLWAQAQVSSPINGLTWIKQLDDHPEFCRNDLMANLSTHFNFIDNGLCFHTPEGYAFILGQIKHYADDGQLNLATKLVNKLKRSFNEVAKKLYASDRAKLEETIKNFLANNALNENLTKSLLELMPKLSL